MTKPDDAALELIAESILQASDEEILQAATACGVDVDTLTAKIKAMVAKNAPLTDVTGYLYTHLDCECGEVNEVEGDASSDVVTCPHCQTRYRILDVR